MLLSPALCTLVACCLLMLGCGGARGPVHKTTGGAVSADAPSWAREGDQKTDEGSLFVCEGEGANEEAATEAARALCSAKICELCGVEVKATVETRETLDKVDVERKVVETCRRVRKSEEQIRYRQAGCGPDGCRAWLQVFFGTEAEARECRAYADGNFADSAQCEDLIEQFRSTPDRTAESFRARVDLLNRAIVACAEIDVRPTPKLTALDEILWQGVVSPQAERREERPIDKTKSIAERLRTITANNIDGWKLDYAERAYRGINRQALLESKIFVDRIALIRDAMVGYESIMTALEAVVDAEQVPTAANDAALVRALRVLKPVVSGLSPAQSLAWAADEISHNRATLKLPGIKAYFMEVFVKTPINSVGYALMDAMVSDQRTDEVEWRFVVEHTDKCASCLAKLLNLPEHGGESTRVARLSEYARLSANDNYITALQDVNPEFLLRSESALEPSYAARVFSYAWLERWLRKLPAAGRSGASQLVRDTYAGKHDWRWMVSPAQHQVLAERAWQLLQAKSTTMRCDDLDKELSLIEDHGVDTRALQPTLCKCVAEPKKYGMRDWTELYQRLVAWGASCVSKEGAR